MRLKLWFDITCIVTGILTLGSLFMAAAYVADINKTEYMVSPVTKTIPYESKAAALVQSGQSAEKSALISEKSGREEILIEMYPAFTYSREWDDEDTYLLARIAMAEAEGATIQCKTLVIMTVLNRAASDLFPDSIREVIFQCDERTGVYQFSCIGNGRWDRVEPDQDCYEAVNVVLNSKYDYSGGALYFESCFESGKEEDNWHSRNLNFLYQCDQFKFYGEREASDAESKE